MLMQRARRQLTTFYRAHSLMRPSFGFLWIISVLSPLACRDSQIKGSDRDLPNSVRLLVSEHYGPKAIPQMTEFGSLQFLRRRYGLFIPYYAEADFDLDGKLDFVCLLFQDLKVTALVGLGDGTGGYALQEIKAQFLRRSEGQNEVYLLIAEPGEHQSWDSRPVRLASPGFYFGALQGPEYLFVWKDHGFETIVTRD